MGTTASSSSSDHKSSSRPAAAAAASSMSSVFGRKLYTRKAYHAGSWYSDDPETLKDTLEDFLQNAAADNDDSVTTMAASSSSLPGKQQRHRLTALIVPHAGYSYSGPTAAYAYHTLQRALEKGRQQERSESRNQSEDDDKKKGACLYANPKLIVVLHPSHHVYMRDKCAVSGATVLETPVGNLKVSDALRQELLAMNDQNDGGVSFDVMTQSQDDREHSGEMQYPFLAKILQQVGGSGSTATQMEVEVLPIKCGSLSVQAEMAYGKALSHVLMGRSNVLTVVSTDFCHWGRRFQYQPMPPTVATANDTPLPIHTFIEQMDRRGMNLIELQQPGAFADYLKETQNTICGRHAVSVWMRAVEAWRKEHEDESTGMQVRFVRYDQSSAVLKATEDSSVSYAAAMATVLEQEKA